MTSTLQVESPRARLSSVWVLPLLALGLGIWLIVDSYLSEGPTVHLTLSTAEGIVAGETVVKRLSVELGTVEEVYLNDGYRDVTAVLQIDADATDLLREDTQFWVVRPRIGTDGVSGLSTLLSGAFIELAPGTGAEGRRDFIALENPPVTPLTTPGLRVQLVSEQSSVLSARSPVYYNGFRVGQIESANLSTSDGHTQYELFINAPYDDLVNANTRFWNASGISLQAGVQGVSVRAESLETLLVGGVAFGLAEDSSAGAPVADGHRFDLYESYSDIHEQVYEYNLSYMLLFDASVRGLTEGAPVEYRGARLGSVSEISFDLLEQNTGFNADGRGLMPVLITIEPGRVYTDDEEGLTQMRTVLEEAVPNGMRASLSNGNLLTGSLYVSLDFYDDPVPAEITEFAGQQVLPTIDSGLVQIEQQVRSLLNTLNELPLDSSLTAATTALQSISQAVATADQTLLEVNAMLRDPATQNLTQSLETSLQSLNEVLGSVSPDSGLYSDLEQMLNELREVARNTRELSASLNAQPSRLLLPSEVQPDLIPGGQQ